MRKLLIVLSFFVLSGQTLPNPLNAERLTGSRAPDFALRDLNGNYVSVSAQRGKAVVLNFWATWCPPCRDEMPSLNSLHNRFKDRGLVVLGVAAGSSGTEVRNFIKKSPLDYTVLLEGMEASRLYNVYSIPTTFLIDKKGFIRERLAGEVDWTSPEAIRKIEELLK